MNLTKKFTILFVPVSSIDHVNSCIGVAETMHSRGHRIVFAVDQSFKGQFIKRGFEEEMIEKQLSLEEQRNPSGKTIKVLTENGLFDDHPPVNKEKMFIRCLPAIATSKDNQILAKIIHRVKPDVIVIHWFVVPSIVKSGIPWVNLVSLQILTLIDDPRTPPKWLGLPSDDPSQWDKYRELVKDDFDFMKNKFYHHLFGDEKPFPLDRFIESPYLNIYSYPLELDYIDKRPLPQAPKWHRFDSFIRMKEEKFDLPEKLAYQKGKLIFLSMGSLGTAHVKLMKRLISLIGDLPFRFIVSKGKFKNYFLLFLSVSQSVVIKQISLVTLLIDNIFPGVYGDQYDLPSNCWGGKMVPQIKVLPKVDLVITHGGNNTVTE